MTGDTQDKLRALILSALMVLSVFAGTIALSGAAAGASSSDAQTAQVSATSAVEYDSGTVEITLDEQVQNPNGIEFYDGNGDLINNDSSPTSFNSSYGFTADATRDLLPTEDVTVTVVNSSGTEVVSNASVTTTAATAQVNTSSPGDLTTYKGGPIALNFSTSPGDTAAQNIAYEILEDGSSIIGPIRTGTNSTVAVLDSSDLDSSAEYQVLVDDASDSDNFGDNNGANISLRNLNQDASLDSSTVTTEEDITGTVSSVTDRSVAVFAQNADGDVVATGGGTTDSNGDYAFNLGNLSSEGTGTYTVVAQDLSTGATVSAGEVTVEEAASISVDFADTNTIDVAQGDIAEITLSLSNTDEADLVIGDRQERGYQANISVTDENGDGEVTVQFNTFTAGRYADVVSAAGDDTATLDDEAPINNILVQTDYGLGVSTDDMATAQDDPENIGTLFVGERSTDQMQLWRAGSLSGISTAEDVAAAVEDGTITQTSTINPGNQLIHQVDATGLEGVLANQSQGSATANFAAALQAEELGLTLEQTETNVPNVDPKALNLTKAVNADALTVIPGDGTYYIAVDTSADILDRGAGQPARTFERGESYEVTFTVPQGDLSDAENGESVSATFTTSEATSSLDQDTWSFESADNQSITGTSTYTSGTQVTVRIESQDPNNPLVDRQRVQVQADGTFEAQFDLSDLPEGTNLSITLSGAGSDSATGQIASAASFEVSDLSAPSTAQIGDTATVTATVTNTGDLEGSTPVEFSIAGMTLDSVTQNVTLAGGESTTVEFNIPVTDELTPGQTYTHGVSAGDGEETAEITIEEQSTPTPTTAEPTTAEPTTAEPTTAEPTTAEPTTAEPTTAEPTTAEPTTAEPTTAEPTGTETMGDDGTTTEESGGGQPGFTMGVGIVALLAAALLALRRRN